MLRGTGSRPLFTGLAAGLAIAWIGGIGFSGESKLRAAPGGPQEAGGTLAFTSGGSGPTQTLFLIDTKSQALAIYRFDPQNPKGALKLEAARQYRWDLKLSEYNNGPPEVSAVESMVGGPKR